MNRVILIIPANHVLHQNIKMGSAIDPGSLVFQWYANFRKTVWMTIVLFTSLLF